MIPGVEDLREAAQSAVETAQEVVGAAVRIPPASAQLLVQLPDLLENLSLAIDRLDTTVDRLDRYLNLAEPMFRTMDRIVPQLESLVATGEDIYRALSNIPGLSTLGRIARGRPDQDSR